MARKVTNNKTPTDDCEHTQITTIAGKAGFAKKAQGGFCKTEKQRKKTKQKKRTHKKIRERKEEEEKKEGIAPRVQGSSMCGLRFGV